MRPAIVAHRGLRSVFPENTIPAVEAALALDIDGVEFDAQLTADNFVAIVHQETLEPNAATRQLQLAHREEGRSWVEQSTAAEIAALDAGSWLDLKFGSVRVPFLPELLALSWNQKRVYLELKDSPSLRALDGEKFISRLVGAINPAVTEFIAGGGLLSFVSFRVELLAAMHGLFPSQQRVLDIWFDKRGHYQEVVQQILRCRADVLCLPDALLIEDPSWLRCCRDNGVKCFTYPVSPAKDEREHAWSVSLCIPVWEQLCSMGVDGIITDFASELCDWMKRVRN